MFEWLRKRSKKVNEEIRENIEQFANAVLATAYGCTIQPCRAVRIDQLELIIKTFKVRWGIYDRAATNIKISNRAKTAEEIKSDYEKGD